MRFISVVAWDQAPHCGKKEKKPAFAQKKKKIGERSEPRGSLGRGKSGGALSHAFDEVNLSLIDCLQEIRLWLINAITFHRDIRHPRPSATT